MTFGEELYTGGACASVPKHACQADPTTLRRSTPTDGLSQRDMHHAYHLGSLTMISSRSVAGSATDGDEDALLGLILMLHSTSTASWPLWERTLPTTSARSRGSTLLVRTCASPSSARAGRLRPQQPILHAPAHYRHSDTSHSNSVPRSVSNATLSAEARQWDTLIATSYQMLDDAQCDSTGLAPNWAPRRTVQARGHAGCNASGTPADQFGSEAARGVRRVALTHCGSLRPRVHDTWQDRSSSGDAV